MKKALILAYDFPPYNSIGAQRPSAWFRYFHEFGIDPVVVTRHWDREITGPNDCNLPSISTVMAEEKNEFGTVVRAPFIPNLRDRLISRSDLASVLLRKTLSVWQLLTEHYIRSSDNKRTIYDAAHNYLSHNQVDIIIACGEPFVLFRYAADLSNHFGIPWVGDYRDGWSTNYRWDDAKLYGLIQKSIQQTVEKRVISTASLLTTAAPSFSKRIAKLSGRDETTIPVIYNGYFHEKFQKLGTVPLKQKLTVVHAGTLYYFQPVETFMDGLNRLLETRNDLELEVVFFGLNFYPEQIARIKACAGKATVTFRDKVPHDEMLKELASSHIQLLLATPEKHQIYAKVFDYLASGRPILMVQNDRGPLEGILGNRRNATICGNAQEVATYLERAVTDPALLEAVPVEDDTFTRRKQTERFANLILETLERNERK